MNKPFYLLCITVLLAICGYALGCGYGRNGDNESSSAPALATFPFPRSKDERPPNGNDRLPKFWDDGRPCSTGCRAPRVVPGWPIKPFHRQHALRAGLNERRTRAFHVGIDIQAPDRSKVYAIQPGRAHIIEASGPEERVQVGNFIYWHVRLTVKEGQHVEPYKTVLGTLIPTAVHLHLSEVGPSGLYLNPLRPAGRALSPWRDTAPPVLGEPEFRAQGDVLIRAFDPQSFRERLPYETPVLAPAALAWRLFDSRSRPQSPLHWSYRGSQHLSDTLDSRVWAPDAKKGDWHCFAEGDACKPNWHFKLAGGLAPPLSRSSTGGAQRLSIYAWDWAGNIRARDYDLP